MEKGGKLVLEEDLGDIASLQPASERSTQGAERASFDEIAPPLVRDQLSKILKSEPFADSQRMARFLRFTVEESLNGNASQLKENVIGTQVFDRDSSYDPRLDPIVRVEARRLRAKLRAYYDGPGASDPIIIEFPKGRYSPVLRMRCHVSLQTPDGDKALENTIAVLPFTNLNTEPGTEFLSDGLTEELINALTRIPDLRVVAWNSVAQMKGRQDELDTIRQRLDVAYVLRGSIRRTRDRLRINAYLIRTSNSYYVWSETYDREFHDIFTIQEEIACAIVSALRLKFWPSVDQRPPVDRSRNIDAYQHCLKGRFHTRERTSQGLTRSIVCFEQAIAIDPACDSAYAGLADTYTLLAEYGLADGPTCMAKAKPAVQRALDLNPASAEAYASFGLILTVYDWLWDEGEKAFKRSLELNPGYAPAHHWYAVDHLCMLGRFEEGHTELETSIKLDPLSAIALEGRGFLLTLTRRYEQALEAYRDLLELDPSFYKAHTSMGRAYLQMGRYEEAIKALEKGLSLAGELPNIYGALGQAFARSGNRSQANRLLERLRQISSSRPVPSNSFALIHLGLGEKDAALGWLERAVERRESPVIGLNVHPAYDDLRGEPRFQRLLQRIGFAR